MDRVSLIAYDNYYRQCKKKMKEAARLHMDFWQGLNTQVPDVLQLIKIGGKINRIVYEVEEYWRLLQNLNANQPKAIKRYAKYLVKVLGEEDYAKELMKMIKHDQSKQRVKGNEGQNIENNNENDKSYLEQCSSDGTPCIAISGDSEKLGTITNVNKAFCRIFGYHPGDLLGHNMGKLIPSNMVEYHSRKVKETSENPDSFMGLNREFLVPVNLANGYILMAHKTIKSLPSFENNMNYVVTFKIDRNLELRDICYIECDKLGNVISCSESIFLQNHTVKKSAW